MNGEDGMPTQVIASAIADLVDAEDPPLRATPDPSIDELLRALDRSDRFRAPFDLSAITSA